MKLPFINESIFEPHKNPIEIRESSYIYIYIYIYGGAREPRMDLKSCSIIGGMSQSMGPRRKVVQGKEEMSQGTQRHSKWE